MSQGGDNGNEKIARRLDSLGAAEQAGMGEIPYGDLAAVSPRGFYDSIKWDQWLFKAEAGPLAARQAPSVSFCVGGTGTEDLLRFEYTFEGNPMVVVESPAYTLAILPGTGEALKGLDAPTRILAIRRLAQQVFEPWVERLPWQARPPSSAEDEIAFTTNPAREPFSVGTFDKRMDAGVWKGHVFFLFYRQVMGESTRSNPRFFGPSVPMRLGHGRRPPHHPEP